MKTSVRIAASLAVAGALLVLLMTFTDTRPEQVRATIARLPASVFFVSFACHLGVYVLRALRFQLLIPHNVRPSFTRALVVSAAHNMASYVLPAKTGETSLIVYLRRLCAVPASVGLASLVVSRLLDGAVLCGGLSLACLALSGSTRYGHEEWFASTGAALLALTLVLGFLTTRGDWLVRLPARVARALGAERRPLGRSMLERATRIAQALRSASTGGRLLMAAATTVPIWLGVFTFYALLGPAMGLPESLRFSEAIFGASLAMLSNLLPVNGVAGFGTQEGGWLIGFTMLDVPADVATSTGMGVHLVQLFNVVLLGLLAHVAMGVMSRRALTPADPAR